MQLVPSAADLTWKARTPQQTLVWRKQHSFQQGVTKQNVAAATMQSMMDQKKY